MSPWLVCRVAVTLVPTSEPLLSVTRAILPFQTRVNGTGHANNGTVDHTVGSDIDRPACHNRRTDCLVRRRTRQYAVGQLHTVRRATRPGGQWRSDTVGVVDTN